MLQIDSVQALVLNALHWDLAVPPHMVKVEVENGWVTMSGTVDRSYQLGKCYAIVIEARRRVMEAKRMAAAETWRRVS